MPAIGAANVQALAIDQHVRDAAAAPAHFGGAERFEIDQRDIAKRQSGTVLLFPHISARSVYTWPRYMSRDRLGSKPFALYHNRKLDHCILD